MELELQAAVSCCPIWVVGSELKSSARVANTPQPSLQSSMTLSLLGPGYNSRLSYTELIVVTALEHGSMLSCVPLPYRNETAETDINGMLSPFCL